MVNTVATSAGTLIRRAFTLIEMLVVLGVISIIALIAFYGLSQYNNTQPLFNAQKELLTNLRSVQNRANNGADGDSIKRVNFYRNSNNTYYTVQAIGDNSVTVNLPTDVVIDTYWDSDGFSYSDGPISMCFANPNLTNYDGFHPCGGVFANSCLSGKGYICDKGANGGVGQVLKSPLSFTIRLKLGNATKTVVLEGSGMKINRIYAP